MGVGTQPKALENCPGCVSMREGLEEFAFAAAHNLRGPMGQVRTLSSLLQRKYGEQLNEDGKVLCGHIDAAAARAAELVEALHAYAKTLTAPNQLAGIDCGEPLGLALAALEPEIRANGAAVTWDALPQVRADREKLQVVFQHLIGNALKFRSETAPRIHVSAAKEPEAFVFGVQDNGIGISGRHFENIFRPLRRLHGQKYPGAGIGLAICRQIVESHGGQIWVESEPELGSVFRFRLPAE